MLQLFDSWRVSNTFIALIFHGSHSHDFLKSELEHPELQNRHHFYVILCHSFEEPKLLHVIALVLRQCISYTMDPINMIMSWWAMDAHYEI